MKKVTYEQFMSFGPCYGAERVKEIAGRKKNWTALDVLRLNKVPAEDRIWAVLREEFIDAPILHEFACRCAEDALKLVDKPDPRSIAAIAAKRAWLRGDISDDELDAARDAARAAARVAARAAAWDAARVAAWDAARAAAWDAARAAAWDAARAAAWDAAWDAARAAAWVAASVAARDAAWVAARDDQIKLLVDMLEATA